MKTVEGGTITHNGTIHPEKDVNGAPVKKIEFQDLAPTADVTEGAVGTMWLARLGKNEIAANDRVYYGNGNRNNDRKFLITGVVGPHKYTVKVID